MITKELKKYVKATVKIKEGKGTTEDEKIYFKTNEEYWLKLIKKMHEKHLEIKDVLGEPDELERIKYEELMDKRDKEMFIRYDNYYEGLKEPSEDYEEIKDLYLLEMLKTQKFRTENYKSSLEALKTLVCGYKVEENYVSRKKIIKELENEIENLRDSEIKIKKLLEKPVDKKKKHENMLWETESLELTSHIETQLGQMIIYKE